MGKEQGNLKIWGFRRPSASNSPANQIPRSRGREFNSMNRELVFANNDSLGRGTPVDPVRCITRVLPCVEGGWRRTSLRSAGCFRKAGRKQAGFGQPRGYADIGEALSVCRPRSIRARSVRWLRRHAHRGENKGSPAWDNPGLALSDRKADVPARNFVRETPSPRPNFRSQRSSDSVARTRLEASATGPLPSGGISSPKPSIITDGRLRGLPWKARNASLRHDHRCLAAGCSAPRRASPNSFSRSVPVL